jgi:WD40 repeat protein
MSWPQGVVVSGSLDKSARTWSIKENKEVCSVIHEDAVLCLQYKPEFSRVATGSGSNEVTCRSIHIGIGLLTKTSLGDACVRFWDPLDPAKVVTMSGHNSNVISIDFNENVIVSGSKDFSVRVWSWDGERLYHFREHADDVRGQTNRSDLSLLLSPPLCSIGLLLAHSKWIVYIRFIGLLRQDVRCDGLQRKE